MLKTITINIPIERRTYIKGFFVGKYVAVIDNSKSDFRRENYYDISIYEADVTITDTRKFDEGEFEEAKAIEKFATNFPSPTPCLYKDQRFKIEIQQPKIDINEEIISDVVIDHDQTFGTVKGVIYGYILHYDYIEKEIEVEFEPDLTPAKVIVEGSKTGRYEIADFKRRDEYWHSDATTYWGDWYNLPKPAPPSPGCLATALGILPTIISILLGIGFLITVGWKIALAILIIVIIGFVLSFLNRLPKTIIKGVNFIGRLLGLLLSWWFRLFSLLILAAIFFACIKAFSGGGFIPKPRTTIIDSRENINPVEPKKPEITTDSLISNFRKWKDYSGKVYEGYLTVSVRDYFGSRNNRLSYPVQPNSEDEMNSVYKTLVSYDYNKLNRICQMFDSLRIKNNIPKGSRQFANVIVSCIQDIPYTLVLQGECNSFDYNDDFIKKYLSNGGDCLADTRYGVLSPVEFMARLKGDCDTRTILLYDILSNFDYDVVVLGSYYYKHSILAINLAGDGVYKYYNNRKYFVWETTMEDMQIGQLPPEISNMKYWNINLKSTNN